MIENLIYTSQRVQAAHKLASELFADKKDRGGQPYIGHLERVAVEAVKKYRNWVYSNPTMEAKIEDFEDVYCAGLLHDVLEDTDYTFDDFKKAFGNNITRLVFDMTKPLDKKTPYEDYIEWISQSDIKSICLKLTDLEDNMDIKRLNKPLKEKDLIRLKKYHDSWLYLNEKLKQF
jgi:(p)ppGpp synthase/HD superfamily hydrolase